MRKRIGWLTLIAFALLLFTGCDLGLSLTPTASPTPSPAATGLVSPVSTPSPTPESSPTPTAVPLTGLTTITLWVPDFMPLYDEADEATELMEQIEAFNRSNRAIQVDVLVKKATGIGGIYQLLETGAQAARPPSP